MNKKCKSVAAQLSLLVADVEVIRVEREKAGERLSEVYLEGLLDGYKKALELLEKAGYDWRDREMKRIEREAREKWERGK